LENASCTIFGQRAKTEVIEMFCPEGILLSIAVEKSAARRFFAYLHG
jgi:hypothetical protein